MPFGVQRGWMRYALPRPEILAYPLSTNVIDSVVLNASGIAPDASGPFMFRRYLVAGTVLSKRSDNTYEQYTGVADTAVGESFTMTFVGPPTGGTFAVSIRGTSSTYIAYPTSAAAIKALLEAIPAVGTGNATVTGPVTSAQGNAVYTVTIAAAQGEVGIPVPDASQLVGPGNQDLVIVEATQETAAGAQNVAGVLFDTVEFADGSELSDEPVAMLRRNVSFLAVKIVNFSALNSGGAITTALSTCEFV
jgi:hypothetical protein